MNRTKSLRIIPGLEENPDRVPPLPTPTRDPPLTAPPRTSFALGPPSATASEFGLAKDSSFLSAPVTPLAAVRSSSPGRGRSWTKTLNFFKPRRSQNSNASTLAPISSEEIQPGRKSDVGPASTRWYAEEEVAGGAGRSGGPTLNLPATAHPFIESTGRLRKISIPQSRSPAGPPPQPQQVDSSGRSRASTVARGGHAQQSGPTLITPLEIRRKRSTTDIRGTTLPAKHVHVAQPTITRQSAKQKEVVVRSASNRRRSSSASSSSSDQDRRPQRTLPPPSPPPPEKPERRKRSSLASFASSKSLTPLQLLRSTGFLGAGMLRDEAAPMEIILSSSTDSHSEPSPQSESTGLGSEVGDAGPSAGLAADAVGDASLNEETAPFDITAVDSMWFQQAADRSQKPESAGPSLTRQVSVRRPSPLPLRKDVALRNSRPVLVLPHTGPDSLSPDGYTEDEVELDSALDELEAQWPLPPRRSLIIVGNKGQLWTSPNCESWSPDGHPFPLRDSICFCEQGGFRSVSVKSRVRRLKFSDEQLKALQALVESVPALVSGSVPSSPLPMPTLVPRRSSTPLSPTVQSDDTDSARTGVKENETRIDADEEGAMLHAVLHLSSVPVAGQLNRITIVASSWTVFAAFCLRNESAVISAVMGDATRCLSVEVLEDERAGKMYCTMMLEGALPEPAGVVDGARRLVTRFSMHLPISLADIGRKCRDSPVGEGVVEVGPVREGVVKVAEEMATLKVPVAEISRSRSRRHAMVLPGFPLDP